jgi:hypothetical protein
MFLNNYEAIQIIIDINYLPNTFFPDNLSTVLG